MAETYWVTFRIADTGDYDSRYQQFVDAVRGVTDAMWWTEPTSFILFRSNHGIDDIASALAAPLRLSEDLAVVGMPEFKDARAIGATKDGDLFKLMPFTKKL